MRDTHTGDDCRIPEDDRCVREMVEQPHPCAEQHGSQIDVNLVEQPGVEALLDRLGAVHSHRLRVGSRFRSSNGAFDAVGDELDCRLGPWPAVGHVVGGDESGHIPRVLAAPAAGALERAPTGEHCADLSHQALGWSALGAETWNVMRRSRARHRDVDVAREVPVENFGDPVVASATYPSRDIDMSAVTLVMA